MIRRFILFCGALFLPALIGAAAEFEIGADQLQWKLSRYCKIVKRNGKSFLRIDVPKGAEDIRKQNCAYAKLDMKPFVREVFHASIKVRGKNVSQPQQPYNGVKFMLYFKNAAGVEFWPSANIPKGTFDWREAAIFADVLPGITAGILRLGLQESSGEVEFDLSSLRITTLCSPEKDRVPLTDDLVRELDLIESRMRECLLTVSPISKEEALELVADQRTDGTFSGINYDDDNYSAWLVARHLGNALRLARVWAAPDHPLHHDKAIGRAVQKAVNWWSEQRPMSSNWWWNDMSVPQTMGNILLLTPELFPEGPARTAALRVCRQAKFMPRYTGNNRVFIAANIFRRALLERNVAPLTEAAAALSEEIRMAPVDDKTSWTFGGIRADGSYHQHGPQIQFGNYGGEFFSNIGYWSNIWKGTRWELSPEQWEIMRHLAFNGFQWVLWNGDMDLLACGRQLGRRAGKNKGIRTIVAFDRLRNADPGSHERYDAVLERNRGGKNTLVGNRHFWNSDYMIHRRPEWYAAVRMNSVRVRPIEDDTNWDNALGRYFSDGVCLVMRSGREYEDITACWDWTRLPGTTLPKIPVYTPEESARRGVRSGGKPPRWTHSVKFRKLGETEFVGGVTDGTHGVAVFTMNLDGVKARKGYFFDTDAVYELGNGITSTSPHPVATTVNSCRRNGEIKRGDNWFWHDGIGYYGKGIKLETGKRKGDWRYVEGGLVESVPVVKELFSLTIDHGLRPQNASYSFAILPGATPEETAGWKGGKILVYTEKLQAVEFADGTTGAIFYAPGTLGDFTTDSPGIFLIGRKQVHAVDPTAQIKSMTLRQNGVVKTVELPSGEQAGSTIKVCFR